MKKRFDFLHWTPRIICILAILFISLFALDAFDPALTIWQQVGAFLMHMIPSFVLTALLVIAWKWEYIGGIIFTLIGVVFTPIIFMHNYKMNNSIEMSMTVVIMITIPFIIVGILFIVNHFDKKRKKPLKSTQ